MSSEALEQAAAEKAAAEPTPLTREQVLQQVQAEGLELRVADNKTGYFGVCKSQTSKARPYLARWSRYTPK